MVLYALNFTGRMKSLPLRFYRSQLVSQELHRKWEGMDWDGRNEIRRTTRTLTILIASDNRTFEINVLMCLLCGCDMQDSGLLIVISRLSTLRMS